MSTDADDGVKSLLAWNQNAEFWNQRMGEGNDFVEVLVWPCVQRLLGPLNGKRVLDIACGNGLYARLLSRAGADVVAVDFAAEMIEAATIATAEDAAIDFRQIDASDPEQLVSLQDIPFDAAVCLMALMDMSDIAPLFAALSALVPAGPFVFATAHPVFNSPHVQREFDASGHAIAVVRQYMTGSSSPAEAIRGQPVPNPFFHRSLTDILAPGFGAGMVLDALEERAFPSTHETGRGPNPQGGAFSEFPAVLVGRMSRRLTSI